MAYTRTYRTIIPAEPNTDLTVMRWLVRESFERKASSDLLRITSYTESVVPPEDIAPTVAKELGKPVDYYQWFRFEAQATNA